VVHVLIRVWLPDRPGALGAVASRIGALKGDIVGLDVLERAGTIAVDEFAVNLEDAELLPMIVREIEEVDGAKVEEVREVKAFPDPRLDALESAAALCDAGSVDELQQVLVSHLRREFLADWVALLHHGDVLALDGDAPADDKLGALAAGTAASPLVADGTTGPEDLGVAPLPGHDVLLMIGREGHPLRRRERAQLLALAGIADRAWELLSD
jgi:hypothetical protein